MVKGDTAMLDEREVEAYNYSTFVGTDDFLGFRTVLPVGAAAPDVSLLRLDDGQVVQLSAYWRNRDVLIEFGSLT